jgi:UDP-N-acetylglucosamine--dolichyl-phosphate N-acetylglucosaminephosphotransferase
LAGAAILSLSFFVPLVVVLLGMPSFVGYLKRSGRVVDDVHKSPPTKVPSPAGPILLLGAIAGEAVAFLTFGTLVPVAVIGAALVAFAIGLADDLFVLGGRSKPLLLFLAAIPFVAVTRWQPDLFQPSLAFPFFHSTSPHFTIFVGLVLLAFPVVSNAFNMMDSFNGQISGFSLLTSLALLFGVVLHAAYTSGFALARIASTLPLVGIAAAFVVFNRYPSRVFDGDSGALMLGAMYAGLAVTGGVEMAAIVAIIPSILNSFFILSSVRGLVERRKMKSRPTYLGKDGKLHASLEKDAPVTLARMLLLNGQLTERELVKAVLSITAIACVLSVITSALTWGFL